MVVSRTYIRLMSFSALQPSVSRIRIRLFVGKVE